MYLFTFAHTLFQRLAPRLKYTSLLQQSPVKETISVCLCANGLCIIQTNFVCYLDILFVHIMVYMTHELRVSRSMLFVHIMVYA